MPPLTLCIDTCGPSLLLVAGGGAGVAAFEYHLMQVGQAEAILPALESLLDQLGRSAKVPFSSVGVTIGPGSFTGLRVGLAVAKARALADGCALHPVNRLQMLARCAHAAAGKSAPVAVAVDARRGEQFVQSFSADLAPLGDAATLDNDAVAAWLEAQAQTANAAMTVREGEAFAPNALAQALLAQALATPAQSHHSLRPLYVRPPDAKRPKETRFTLTQ